MPCVKPSDINIYYEVHGQGAPVLLIAGTGGSHHGWMLETVPRLKERFKVIVYDHRGTGQSDKPDKDYSMQLLARDAVELLDAIGVREPVRVCGHSMGGRIAQWLALDYPDRVRSLVLACTGSGRYDDFVPARGIPLRHALEMIELGYDGYRKYYATCEFMFPKEFAKSHPELMGKMEAKAVLDNTPLKAYLRHIIARQDHDTLDRLDQIKAPTLVLEGAKDNVVRGTGNHVRSSQVLAEKIPGARLELIPGCAHGIFVQEPELVHRLMIEFYTAH